MFLSSFLSIYSGNGCYCEVWIFLQTAYIAVGVLYSCKELPLVSLPVSPVSLLVFLIALADLDNATACLPFVSPFVFPLPACAGRLGHTAANEAATRELVAQLVAPRFFGTRLTRGNADLAAQTWSLGVGNL